MMLKQNNKQNQTKIARFNDLYRKVVTLQRILSTDSLLVVFKSHFVPLAQLNNITCRKVSC